MTISVVIADDEPIARSGLRDMLAEYEWLSIVGEAADGPAAVRAINTLRPELALCFSGAPHRAALRQRTRAQRVPGRDRL